MPGDREGDHACDEARGPPENRGHLLLLLARDPAPERQAQVLARRLLRLGEVALGVAEVAQRRLEVQRRRVVGGDARCRPPRAPPRAGRARASARRTCGRRGPARPRAARRSRRGRARRSARPPRGAGASTRRGAAGRSAAPPPGSRRAASCSRRTRSPSWRASRGSAASGSGRRARRRCTATRPPSPSAKRFFDGKKLKVEAMLVAIPGEPNAWAASSTSGSPRRAQLLDRRRPAEEVHGHDRLRPLA